VIDLGYIVINIKGLLRAIKPAVWLRLLSTLKVPWN
jgi:hypothetical protein